MNDVLTSTGYHAQVDSLHRALAQLPTAATELTHRFTPGLYSRQFFMPRKSCVISRVHKTEHQFAILTGRAMVWTEGGLQDLKAPHIGVTKPGTRRVLYIVDDCTWVTFHPTNETDLAKLEAELVEAQTEVGPVTGDQVALEVLTKLRQHAALIEKAES